MVAQKPPQLQLLSSAYFRASVAGERTSAQDIVSLSLSKGLSVLDIYEKVITPALVEVGLEWATGGLTISQEHLATQITLEQMTLLREKISPKHPNGKKALATTLPGDQHELGARMVADYFYADGWDVEFLGPDTPVEEILRYVSEKEIDVILISMSSQRSIAELKKLCKKIKEIAKPPLLIVGGRATGDPAMRGTVLKPSVIADNPLSALNEARKYCKLSGVEKSLNQVLIQLGEKISAVRSEKGMSQKVLAEASELDRAYISSIENGKKNVTISAMLRIAAALEIPLTSLLQE